MKDYLDMKSVIRAVLQEGPSTVPDIARALYPDLPDYQQSIQQCKIRHHLYVMERNGEIMSDRRGQRKLATWWLA